jgi:hypothetical protein
MEGEMNKKVGLISFLLEPRNNRVKIGWTTKGDPHRRKGSLQNHGSVKLYLLGAVTAMSGDELAVYERFANYRVKERKEWFYYEGELKDYVEKRFRGRVVTETVNVNKKRRDNALKITDWVVLEICRHLRDGRDTPTVTGVNIVLVGASEWLTEVLKDSINGPVNQNPSGWKYQDSLHYWSQLFQILRTSHLKVKVQTEAVKPPKEKKEKPPPRRFKPDILNHHYKVVVAAKLRSEQKKLLMKDEQTKEKQ